MADLIYAAVIEKQTGESWDEEFDFEGRIAEGTTVTDYAVVITRADGVLATEDVWNEGESSMSSQTVTLRLLSLDTETAYVIDVEVQASDESVAHMRKLLCVDKSGVYR